VRINTNANAPGNIGLIAGITTVNTLLQNTATAGTVDIGSGNTLATDGIMIASGKEALTIGAASGDGSSLSTATAGGNLYLTNSNAGKTLTVNAVIADNAASGLVTAGNVILNGANLYTGATTVNAGALNLGQGGSLAATAVSVASGATLGLSQSTSSTTIAGGASLSLANGSILNLQDTNYNTLAIGGVATLSGATMKFDIGTSVGQNDKLTLGGAATLSGTNVFSFNTPGGSSAPGLYTLISAPAGGLDPVNFGLSSPMLGTYTLSLSGDANNIYLNILDINNSKLWVGTTPPTASAETTSVSHSFGRVMQGSTTSTGVDLSVDGTHASLTNASVTASGAASTTTTSPGTLSALSASGINAGLITSATGVKTGAVTIDNLATTTAGTSLGSDNGNAVINVDGTVLANRTLTATTLGDLGLQHVGATYAGPSTTTVTTASGTAGDDDHATRVTLGGGSQNGLTVDASLTVFNSASQGETRAVSGTFTTAGVISGSISLTTTTDATETATGTVAQTTAVTYTANVFSGTGKWSSASNGSWGTLANANWNDAGVHAAPGTFGTSFDNVDTAVFDGTGAGQTISLDGTSPSVKALNFSGATAYTVAQGSGGTLVLKSDSGTANISATSGGHTISAPLQLDNNGSVAVTNLGDTLTVSGAISGSGMTLTKTGAGTLALSGTNSYDGTTTISGGTLQIGDGGASGSLATGSAIVDDATLSFKRSNTLTQGTDFNSLISGSGAVVQAGSGTTILTGANNYGGGTTVSTGTLLVNNTTGSGVGTGALSVTSGATLGGSGTIGGSSTIQGISAPGNPAVNGGIGIQTFSNGLAYAASSHLQWQLSGNTTSGRGSIYDGVNVTTGGTFSIATGATLDLGFSGTVDFTDLFWTTAQTWTIADLDLGVNDSNSGVFKVATIPTGTNNYSPTLGSFKVTRATTGKKDVMLNWNLGTPFQLWMLEYDFSAYPGADTTETGDVDGDGASNLDEFAFAGNPADPKIKGLIYGFTADSSADGNTTRELILTVAVRTGTTFSSAGAPALSDATVDGIDYAIQGSTNLTTWTTAVTPVTQLAPPAGLPTIPAGYQYMSFSLNGSDGLAGRGFLRARVVQP